MPRLVASILLSITVVAAAPVFFVVVFAFVEVYVGKDLLSLAAALFLSGPLLVLAWICVWRRHIAWTVRRNFLTLISAVGSAAVAGGFFMLLAVVMGWNRRYVNDELCVVLSAMCFAVIWLVTSVLAWRETPAERAVRLSTKSLETLACPRCGYNMVGLHEARCPECGSQYTLDSLFSAAMTRGIPTDLAG